MKSEKKSIHRIRKRVTIIFLFFFFFMGLGAAGYYLSQTFFAEAQIQIPLPLPTNPPLSCTGCHDFQKGLFTSFPYHHPNAITYKGELGPVDMISQIKAVRQDCCGCHNYLLNHTGGMVLLKDPDSLDGYPYNGDPVATNNFCLSCHDRAEVSVGFSDYSPSANEFDSLSKIVRPWRVIAPQWSLPCGHSVNPRRSIRCLDCHKYHGSNFKGMLMLDQPQLCYMNGCHPEKAIEFDPANPSHHHIEGVILGGVPINIISCNDCHNPHHNTNLALGYVVSDPYSTLPTDIPSDSSLPMDLYPVTPQALASSPPILNINTNSYISGVPFYINNTNAAGVPTDDLFCLECHAPDIFVPPNPSWPGAPNISFEIKTKYHDPLLTTSNFFYPHQHVVSGSCSTCHINKAGVRPYRVINGHFTHLKNASCTYCHDPHGTKGTYAGNNSLGVIGQQRGHLLREWLMVDRAAVNQLPYGGGYLAAGIYSAATITRVDGASSCFINLKEPAQGCHDLTHEHKPGVIKPLCVCNTTACHLSYSTPTTLLKQGETVDVGDRLPPAPPQ